MINLISQQSDQPVAHLCPALEISLATFYRQREQDLKPDPVEMIIHNLAAEFTPINLTAQFSMF